jgi:FlaG/FlaF family flagellin (archaellin)
MCDTRKKGEMEMKIRSMMSCDNAVSTVVSAVLLLGIIVSVITVVNVQYIPEWKTAAEQSHMDDIFYDMAGMKNDVDMLSAYVMAEPSTGLSLSVPFRMGGGSLPVFSAGKSGGRLAINDDVFSMYIEVTGPNGPNSSGTFFEDMGTVSYMSSNNYFVDQKYMYENGALILSQEEYSLMRLSPQINLRKIDNGGNISLDINSININGPKRSISSNSVEELNLRTNKKDSLDWKEEVFTRVEITVESSHPLAWEKFFERLAIDAGLDPLVEYSVSEGANPAVFIIESIPGSHIMINATRTSFDARLNILS